MCKSGETVTLEVPIPAGLSHTGRMRWENKPIDSCISGLVAALNGAGRYTASSCCGHGEGDGSVILHDGTELTISAHPHRSVAGALWQLLDDIDTLDDACRSDDAAFRVQVRRAVKRRLEYGESPDGYTLVLREDEAGTRPPKE